MKKFFIVLFLLVACSFTYIRFTKDNGFNTDFSICEIEGNSMNPNIKDGDVYFTYSLPFMEIERNDVVVFDNVGRGHMIIKRVIGIPGDYIEVIDGKVYVNGDSSIDYMSNYELNEEMKKINFSVQLEDDEYFALGDNRNNSWDCRYVEEHYFTTNQVAYKPLLIKI